MPKSPEWVYAQMIEVELQLDRRLKGIIGSPNHDVLSASAHAYAFGQLQGILDVVMREGVDRRLHLVNAPLADD